MDQYGWLPDDTGLDSATADLFHEISQLQSAGVTQTPIYYVGSNSSSQINTELALPSHGGEDLNITALDPSIGLPQTASPPQHYIPNPDGPAIDRSRDERSGASLDKEASWQIQSHAQNQKRNYIRAPGVYSIAGTPFLMDAHGNTNQKILSTIPFNLQTLPIIPSPKPNASNTPAAAASKSFLDTTRNFNVSRPTGLASKGPANRRFSVIHKLIDDNPIKRQKARAGKSRLLKAYDHLEKAKKELAMYSATSEIFRRESLVPMSQLERLIDQEIFCGPDSLGDNDGDSAYYSNSIISSQDSLSSTAESVCQAQSSSSSTSLEQEVISADSMALDHEPPQLTQETSLFHCTYFNDGERCSKAFKSKSDWRRHEESDQHWPQKRFMCLLCNVPMIDEGTALCVFCLDPLPSAANSASHALRCAGAKQHGRTFSAARRDHFRNHLRDWHGLYDITDENKTWTYSIESKWERQCGFCEVSFITWDVRVDHVAEHFQEGANISDWKLPFRKRRIEDRPPGSNWRDDDDNDDDDDNQPGGRKGKQIKNFPSYPSSTSTEIQTNPQSTSSDVWWSGFNVVHYSLSSKSQAGDVPRGNPRRYIRGTEGKSEKLDTSYVRSPHYRKSFSQGQIFKTLWADPSTSLINDNNNVRYNERVRTKRFVIVHTKGDRSCIRLPVTTYREGYRESGINLDEHRHIYRPSSPRQHHYLNRSMLEESISSSDPIKGCIISDFGQSSLKNSIEHDYPSSNTRPHKKLRYSRDSISDFGVNSTPSVYKGTRIAEETRHGRRLESGDSHESRSICLPSQHHCNYECTVCPATFVPKTEWRRHMHSEHLDTDFDFSLRGSFLAPKSCGRGWGPPLITFDTGSSRNWTSQSSINKLGLCSIDTSPRDTRKYEKREWPNFVNQEKLDNMIERVQQLVHLIDQKSSKMSHDRFKLSKGSLYFIANHDRQLFKILPGVSFVKFWNPQDLYENKPLGESSHSHPVPPVSAKQKASDDRACSPALQRYLSEYSSSEHLSYLLTNNSYLNHYPPWTDEEIPIVFENIFREVSNELITSSSRFQSSTPMMTMPNSRTNEAKPRLRKEEVDILEREFEKNPKPSTQIKRQFAEDMNVELAKIHNWFQNRRAKRKQELKQESREADWAEEGLVSPEPSFRSSVANMNSANLGSKIGFKNCVHYGIRSIPWNYTGDALKEIVGEISDFFEIAGIEPERILVLGDTNGKISNEQGISKYILCKQSEDNVILWTSWWQEDCTTHSCLHFRELETEQNISIGIDQANQTFYCVKFGSACSSCRDCKRMEDSLDETFRNSALWIGISYGDLGDEVGKWRRERDRGEAMTGEREGMGGEETARGRQMGEERGEMRGARCTTWILARLSVWTTDSSGAPCRIFTFGRD